VIGELGGALLPVLRRNDGRPLRVLLSAYACEPRRGSEPGIGWNWMRQISRFAEVWVITRESNRVAIETFLEQEPIANVHFSYFDLPRWARFWKKGGRGLQLYYYLWQIGIIRKVRKLHGSIRFDVAHHVTFGTCWFPSSLSFLGVPFVWGPVGGGERAPWSFWRSFSWRGKLHEIARTMGRARGDCDPFVRFTARHAAIALATTAQSEQSLRAIGCQSTEILSHAALDEEEISRLQSVPARKAANFRIFSIGRLLHWKGLHLGLRAFAGLQRRLPDSQYWIIGEGPEQGNLKDLARELGIEKQVLFVGQVSRDQVLDKIAECDVMLHPTLHDSSGWASVEAMACGRPVVCLDLAGPALQVDSENGFKVQAKTPEQAIRDLTEALTLLANDPEKRLRMGRAARAKVVTELNWSRKAERIQGLYDQLITKRQDGAETSNARRPASAAKTEWV
jgi:glycosyltransferase involved in cell wall biosynthesis